MTQQHIIKTLTLWRKNHPDCKEEWWYVQNAIGTLLGFPDWWVEFNKDK